MTMAEDMMTLVERYFVQQAQLYGKEFYVDTPVNSRGSRPQSLNEFYMRIKDCQRCQLAASRTNFVFGVGNSQANLMCVGEAPGFEEDREGEPFVGKAGQLLNKILQAIGFRRDEVYIANIIKCRPPGNRDPEPDEIAACLPYLKQQIELVQPRLILALGRIAAQSLLQTSSPLGKLRGEVHDLGGVKVVVTYHPAALLRNPQWKRNTWEDVKQLRKLYDEIVGDKPKMNLN
ncbi:MAG: uracil-DNA glycosylase [Calditrichaeota bacterium]|nr:MAG: uracil-DNA glycosylase [Calditrichota bacterium]